MRGFSLITSVTLFMYNSYNEIDFSGFENREEELKKIWRYKNYPDYFYRSNDFQHTIRIFHMINHFKTEIESVFEGIDFKKLQIMALVHDDVEIIIGDFQAGNKLNMTDTQLSEKDQIELAATDELTEKYPKEIEGYNYRELLLEVFHKNTSTAQLVKFFDHLDALGEALNEYFAGNISSTINAQNEYGKIILPFDYYRNRFNENTKYYPLISELFSIEKVSFNLDIPRLDFENAVSNFSKHTDKSVKIDTGYKVYDLWKKNILENNELNDIYSMVDFSEGRFYDKEKNIFYNKK